MARRARALRDQQGSDQPQALRRHLVQVTQRLLAAHGLGHLTTRSIAREAEVSDGVLYNYFADKDALVVAALAEQIGDISARFQAALPQAGRQDLHSGLTLLGRQCMAFQAEALPLFAGLVTRPDLVHLLIEQVHSGEQAAQLIWSRIVDYLDAERELGTIAADVDPHTVTHILFGAGQLQVLSGLMSGHLGAVEAAQHAAHHAAPIDEASMDHVIDFLVRACTPR